MFGVCEVPGCKSTSACRPVVIVRAKRKPEPAKPSPLFARNVAGEDRYEVRYEVQMEFCSAHQDAFRRKYLLNEASWSAIENQLRQHGMAPPDKDAAEVLWEGAAGADGLDDAGRAALEGIHGRKLGTHPLSGRLP